MNEKHIRILLTLFWILILSAWMVSCTVEKRLYNRGYHLNWKRNYSVSKSSHNDNESDSHVESEEIQLTIQSKEAIGFSVESAKIDSTFWSNENEVIESESENERTFVSEKVTVRKAIRVHQKKHGKQKSAQYTSFGNVVLIILLAVVFAALLPLIFFAYMISPTLVGIILLAILILALVVLFIAFTFRGVTRY